MSRIRLVKKGANISASKATTAAKPAAVVSKKND